MARFLFIFGYFTVSQAHKFVHNSSIMSNESERFCVHASRVRKELGRPSFSPGQILTK